MKKVIIVIITGIAVFIIVTLLMNKCTSALRESIENETIKQVETTSQYDLDRIIGEYNFITYNQISDYVNYILDNYVDEKFRNYIDTFEIEESVTDSLVKKYSNGRFIINSSINMAQENVFAYMFKSNSDWTDLPITDNFREKFSKAGSIANYYSLPEDLIDKGKQNGFSIIITDNIPENYESIEYRFVCIFNDDGYFDNIYYFGRYMEEYMPPDSIKLEIELDDVDVIKACVHEICVSEEYLMKGGDELTDFDDYISGMNNLKINYKYRDEIFNSNGILPIKDYIKDSLEVVSYDENTKEARVKIETKDKKIYYKIKLDIDEYYCLENATVELDREEDR